MAVETTPKKILDKLNEILTSINGAIVPIGGVIAWLKSFTGTPSLPSGFVECNGQTLDDSDSVFDNEVIPDLNGDNQFVRGNSTSGGTGGASSVIAQLATQGGAVNYGDTTLLRDDSSNNNWIRGMTAAAGSIDFAPLKNRTVSFSIIPPYYNVVWIMRVK